jgi:hypothetical protein
MRARRICVLIWLPPILRHHAGKGREAEIHQ